MNVALLVIAALILGIIGFLVFYAKTYAASANLTTKVVWGLNIGLLVAVLAGLVWYALGPGAS